MKPQTRPLAVAVLGRGLVDPDEPVIHADDAGLLRGLAAFETVRVYAGVPFALSAHLDRLGRSAARLRLPCPPIAALEELSAAAIAATDAGTCSLRLTLTGGRDDGQPVAIAMVVPVPPDLDAIRARGISCVTLQLGIDPRLRSGAPWLLDGVKSTSYAVNMAAWDEAHRRGADDAIFVAAEGSVLEGTVTNVWWRRGGVLRTPALDLGIMAGVTRGWVMRLADAAGYRVEEGWYPVADLAEAEEAFTSSSVRELMPIVDLDGRPVGSGRPGPAARTLQASLRQAAGG